MGETTANTSGACELVLDYVYGELDEDKKRVFEEHLPACARCQQEVASFGRVRTAAKAMMPAVEPPPSLGGALHAQLMHAAAQRKPRRGILLSFPRKIVEHPALSAAAMFVLVGGAIAINWSHGKLAMPAAEHAEVDAPKPTEATSSNETAKVAEAPVAEPAEPMPAAKLKEGAVKEGAKAENARYKGGDLDNKPAEDKTQIALASPTGGEYTVQRPAAHRGAAAPAGGVIGTTTGTANVAVAKPAPKKAPPARMKNIAVDGKMAKYDSVDDLAGAKDESAGLGALGGAAAGGRASGNAKSSAPEELAPPTTVLAEKAPTKQAHAAAAPSAPPPPPAATMQSTTPSAASKYRDGYFSRSQAQTGPAAVQKPASSTRNLEVARKQADEFAKSGRCEEAIKLYEELEKAKQPISPTERASWVRCLAQTGRQEEAAQQVDSERERNDSRRKVEAKKAKKSPAPADRAPATESVQQSQQKRPAGEQQQQPAQATPPDSTNTKVKTSSPAY